jgi:3-oxoacyl-(acyl-carrier-protein) synthase
VSLESVLEMVKRTAGGAVDADAPLMESGVDSLGAVELRNQLQSAAGLSVALPSTLVFDYPTARQLASKLEPKQAGSAIASRTAPVPQSAGRFVSIDGLSALFPGGAPSLAAASMMVACGRGVITQVPATRWDVHSQPSLAEPVASRVRHLGFVRDAQLADNAAFGVSHSEAAAMDPCQRLVLERGYAALADAYMQRAALSGSLTGVFLGFAGTEFNQVLANSPAGSSVYAATGSSLSIASGRISYALGLQGPCVSYDTACSAALAASHASFRALQHAECDASIAVGITLMLVPAQGTTFAVAGMTSPRGRCHTFDASADGYARGEACGASAMRPDNRDLRRFSLQGSAVRQDGRSASLTAPSGQAQGGLILAAVSDAAATADELTLNEAHGTGTALGDPIEAGSLVAAVLSLRDEHAAPLALGGVKANIGHAEPAAGMTGLLKLASGLENATAAPNAQMRVLNPMVSGAFRGLRCALAAQPANMGGATQVQGGVSSFGYSGTIAHAVLCREAHAQRTQAPVQCRSGSKRHAFMWCDTAHAFVQRRMPVELDGAITFRSPAMGALHDLVADHIVLGRIIFPAVGYLEMARAAAGAEGALHGVFFLNPLAVETPGLLIECVVSDGRFEVRSGEDDDSLDEAAAHCAGSYASAEQWQRTDLASLRASSCVRGASVAELYDGFKSSGLQYGVGFRRLVQGWGGANDGAAKLQPRASSRTNMHVHPADLDDALCASALLDPSAGSATSETRLPFAVDDAQLQKAPGGLWAVRTMPCLTTSLSPP